MSTAEISATAKMEGATTILECPQGGSCFWAPSLIHWGGSCEPNCEVEPRASIAVTFRRNCASKSIFEVSSSTDVVHNENQLAILVGDLNNLPLERRLAFVAMSLMNYSQWHPGFPGMDVAAPSLNVETFCLCTSNANGKIVERAANEREMGAKIGLSAAQVLNMCAKQKSWVSPQHGAVSFELRVVALGSLGE